MRTDSSASLAILCSPAVFKWYLQSRGQGGMRTIWRWTDFQFLMTTDFYLCKIPGNRLLVLRTTAFCMSCFCLLLSFYNPTLKCSSMAAQLWWILLSLSCNFKNSEPQVHETGITVSAMSTHIITGLKKAEICSFPCKGLFQRLFLCSYFIVILYS